MADCDKLQRALAAIDAANADDPQRIRVRGQTRPKELAHGELMSEWIERLRPDAGEALRLAARAHHVRRWEIGRERYPEGRAGYHRWRRALQEHHARIAGEILAQVGYGEALIGRVRQIVQKQGPRRDPDAQAFEDALCLTFLETQFHDLAARLDEEKLLHITRKTLRGMSQTAIELAATLPLEPSDRAAIERATLPCA
ncbi:MAG: DUF4202 domain-containing protein [Myxococcales bacterium]|nr:DUF4202 domain-containing protein [Myxococcales bacterium]MDH5566235.1 DUF4202 domain-containing protein [Myxococcales bacterium]